MDIYFFAAVWLAHLTIDHEAACHKVACAKLCSITISAAYVVMLPGNWQYMQQMHTLVAQHMPVSPGCSKDDGCF